MQPRSTAFSTYSRPSFRPLTSCFTALVLLLTCGVSSAQSQGSSSVPNFSSTDPGAAASRAVPGLMKFSGTARDSSSKPLNGVVGITFALYTNEVGGASLWMETQNVQADASGRYSVSLGAGKALPVELFSSGEARWLGVQIAGQPEQNRILLLSVPYALKAADAQTLGGLPPSAFVLAAPAASLTSTTSAASQGATAQPLATGTTPVTTAGGAVNKLAKFDANADVTNSQVFDNGTNVGIGNTAPAAKLDVSGTGIFRGALSLPATAAATSTVGKTSQPFNFTASSFSSSTLKAVNETFRWQAEPFGNNTATPSGTLNLLFGSGTAAPTETGLKLSSKGLFTFATGQTFPGTGSGTVTSVALAAPASDFTVSGSPITGAGTLNLAWTVAPTAANSANAIVKRDGSGNFAANAVTATTVNAGDVNASGTITVNTQNSNAVFASSSAVGALTIEALAVATSGPGVGVLGYTSSGDANAKGVYGSAADTSGAAQGVNGVSFSPTGLGVVGQGGSNTFSGAALAAIGLRPIGILGDSSLSGGVGVLATADDGRALWAVNNSSLFSTVEIANKGTSDLIEGQGPSGYFFLDGAGNLSVSGTIFAGVKDFRIDHPLDPSGKYLTHASIESSEMLNLYTGNAVLGADGSAAVPLPDWFTTLNEDFRYQLTPIGGFAQLYIAEEITGNQFRIAGGRGGMKVSWQVTGVRRDAYAKAHPLVVESDKQGEERGHYLHPDAFGQPLEMGITAVRRAKLHAQHAAKPAAAPVILKGVGVTKPIAR
jgi:trimeric autotransporter adhesin